MIWYKLAACFVLVVVGGILAGLTIGLISLDMTNLEILAVSGTDRQKYYAKKIIPLRRNGHLLLVTLLLGNTIVNESLPILFDSVLGGGVRAIVVSTVLIVIFGEIIPQSLCARYGLEIGAFFSIPLRILQFFLYPLAYPVSMILDYVLGSDKKIVYQKDQLKQLVSMNDTEHGGSLTHDEVTIIQGALDLSEKLVVDVMTDLNSVYMVKADEVLDFNKLSEIVERGHSRIPVYINNNRNDIVGILLVKSLVLLNPDNLYTVSQVPLRNIPWITSDISLYDLLNTFQEGGCHMAVVASRSPKTNENVSKTNPILSENFGISAGGLSIQIISDETIPLIKDSLDQPTSQYSETGLIPVGIITLEDVIEELIQEEIIDETDVFMDIRNNIKVSRVLNSARLGGGRPMTRKSTQRSHLDLSSIGRSAPDSSILPPRRTKQHFATGSISDIQQKSKKPVSSQIFLGTKTFPNTSSDIASSVKTIDGYKAFTDPQP
ncbi:DUF21 domain-containing protein [Smittium mucronatum]|uniref:DUF21 domain-containing protein n=1 Tax=Smittium mucronatum TaxID=133383 RepID=A0A1R0GZ37_9FUNG|nr:DUF21 domain-containing protein [Smittium mucronatum]